MVENRCPQPPPGFVPFKWKTKPSKSDKSISIPLCPACGGEGTSWGGKDSFGWQDPKAQAVYDTNKGRWEKGEYSYDAMSEKVDGVMLKSHWSRWGTGDCMKCGVKFWHDFIGEHWHYYFNPATAKVKITWQPMLF